MRPHVQSPAPKIKVIKKVKELSQMRGAASVKSCDIGRNLTVNI